jgi:hypothetical protein
MEAYGNRPKKQPNSRKLTESSFSRHFKNDKIANFLSFHYHFASASVSGTENLSSHVS